MGNKRILDACCGSKMFWFDKNNPDVEFCDIRKLDKTEFYPGRYIEINPDTICDFQNLPFPDNEFSLVVFDPPHLKQVGDTAYMNVKYGKLDGNWKTMLSKGFDECMRVLKPNGVLIFKWSEVQINTSSVFQKAIVRQQTAKASQFTLALFYERLNTSTKDKIKFTYRR